MSSCGNCSVLNINNTTSNNSINNNVNNRTTDMFGDPNLVSGSR